MSKTTRASLPDLMAFCNKVREAGGGNAIDALIPSVPVQADACLIARNLNFNCAVDRSGPDNEWTMNLESKDLRDKIASTLGLKVHDTTKTAYSKDFSEIDREVPVYHVILPKEIGQVAADFDRVQDQIIDLLVASADTWQFEEYDGEKDAYVIKVPAGWDPEAEIKKALATLTPEQKADLVEFLPYIEASNDETRKVAAIVNADGSIVV